MSLSASATTAGLKQEDQSKPANKLPIKKALQEIVRIAVMLDESLYQANQHGSS
jgi:hypothetical protein